MVGVSQSFIESYLFCDKPIRSITAPYALVVNGHLLADLYSLAIVMLCDMLVHGHIIGIISI